MLVVHNFISCHELCTWQPCLRTVVVRTETQLNPTCTECRQKATSPATAVSRQSTRTNSRFVKQMFNKANRPRVLRRNFARLREAVALQRWKRGAKAKADAVATLSLQRWAFRSLRQRVATAAASRIQRANGDAFSVRKLMMRGWESLRDHPAEKKVTSRCDTGLHSVVFGGLNPPPQGKFKARIPPASTAVGPEERRTRRVYLPKRSWRTRGSTGAPRNTRVC